MRHEMTDKQELRGGVNTVIRLGDTVHRPASPASSAIHRLLRHLRAEGFTGAPEPLGYDDEGNEVLSFLPGDVHDSLPPHLRTSELLTSAAALLRRLHDASATFVARSEDRWQLPARSPAEVICHGDTAPYNCVIRDGLVVGIFDFDVAHPGPRLWDLAYAVYRFAPLHAADNPDGFGDPKQQAARVAHFCRTYGHPADARVLDAVTERLVALIDYMKDQAARGNKAFQRHIAEGHHDLYEADLRYLAVNREVMLRVFEKA